MAYIDIIKEKARSDRKTIVLPETTDKRTLIAASHIIQDGIANIIMIGNEEKIMDGAGCCWSFQSDFTNEMGNIVVPDEPGATASMPTLPKTAILAVSLCLLIIS